MNLTPKFLIRLLEKNGFVLKRTKGSHQIFYNKETNKTVIVPIHGGRDIPKGTFYAIIKQSGIENIE